MLLNKNAGCYNFFSITVNVLEIQSICHRLYKLTVIIQIKTDYSRLKMWKWNESAKGSLKCKKNTGSECTYLNIKTTSSVLTKAVKRTGFREVAGGLYLAGLMPLLEAGNSEGEKPSSQNGRTP